MTWRWWGWSTFRWIVENRAWSWWYLVRYARFIRLRITHPDVIVKGPLFLGKGVRFERRRGLGRIIVGRWVHLGDGTTLRCHEGTLTIGDKCVFGQNNTVNCHIDVSVGSECIVADWVYVGDFDHRTDVTAVSIRRQGLIKTPVIIGPDVWLGVKSTVLRGSVVGEGTVIAANAVVRGSIPAFSIAGGIPAVVMRDRKEVEAQAEQTRIDVEDMARKAREATQRRIDDEP